MDRVERIREIDALISSGDYDSALGLLEDLEKEMREEGGSPQLFSVLWRKGWILYRKRDLRGALESLVEAADLLPLESLTPSLLYRMVFVLSTAGAVAHEMKEFERAVEYHRRAIDILESIGEHLPPDRFYVDTVRLRNNLANSLVGMGKFSEAEETYLSALSLIDSVEVKGNVLHLKADLLYNLGSLYYYLNDVKAACRMWREASILYDTLCREQGDEVFCRNAGKLSSSLEMNCS